MIIGISLLILIYLFLIMPRLGLDVKKYTQMGELYAHRGLHNNKEGIPENSMAAFRKAVDAGYGIELDVQMTKDGVPVIFHDYTLERMCGVEGRLSELCFEELQKLALLNTSE